MVGSPGSMFRLVLLSEDDVGTEQAAERIERLCLLDGGRHVAIVLLLSSERGMVALVQLQAATMLNHQVPILPISCTADLVPCLDSLRLETNSSMQPQQVPGDSGRDLVARCVRGPPLSPRKAGYLTDYFGDMKGLVGSTSSPQGQRAICDLVGERDGRRVIAFFTEGPRLPD
ncbi:hypothetical protein B0I35DRAFT_136502 [Stachybotrys elegans]|uniref:Uncharacterized protein n=1 Tax=Stachybotrys elegans TaxID=80388 RepID=A0A8K0SYS7_9HYPO|nr:hypothetical protein B0I35DRAFT_136502 [Stachybotrys elegans]